MPYTTYGLLKTIRSHTISSPTVGESVSRRPAERLQPLSSGQDAGVDRQTLRELVRDAAAPLGTTEQRVAASLLWLLRGDAGQRAIVAQAMGWAPAQQASGTDWMAPHLAQLLDDPYDAVRSSLRARSARCPASPDLLMTCLAHRPIAVRLS